MNRYLRDYNENGCRIVGVCPNCLEEISMAGEDQHHISYNLDSTKKETVVNITCHWRRKIVQ